MKYTISTIEERVLALLDENKEINDQRTDFADPGASLSGLISMFLPDAVRISLCSVSLSAIDECSHISESVSVTHLGGARARYDLPDDFLRLVNIRMDDWAYGVSTPLAFDTDAYRLRMADGCRGRHRRTRPAVAVIQAGENKVLNIFGTSPYSKIAELDYVAMPEIDDDIIELPSGTLSDVCERIADMVRLTINNGISEIT